MNRWITFWALVALLTFPMFNGGYLTAKAAEEDELTPAQQEAVKRAVQRYLEENQLGETRPQMEQRQKEMGGGGPSERRESLSDLNKPRELHGKYDSSMEGSGTLIYSRPFVASPKAILGGYSQFEYRNFNKGGPSTFDHHRFVPFIYADVSQNVKVATEIEIEHGIREGTETEISLEFATVDYLMHEAFNFRGGVVLLPVGKFNLLHDAPLRDITDRPFVDTYIIPTTLSETGVGFYGTFYPTQLSQLNYEVYVTTGFNGYNDGSGCSYGSDLTMCTGLITDGAGLKDARQRKSNIGDGFDNNNGKAVVGRVAFSPILGVEVGGSGYFGAFDPNSKRPLSITAVDWTIQRGPFEVIGEAAWAYVRDNSWTLTGMNTSMTSGTGSPLPQRMSGYYIQTNYHFLPSLFVKLAPNHFRPETSTFTAVVRWEEANTNKDNNNGIGQYQQLTLGLNFRPLEDTVFKVNYLYTPETNNGSQRIHNNGFVASVASYF